LSSEGSKSEAELPGNGPADTPDSNPVEGGGVYTAPSLDGPFRPFDDGLPERTRKETVSVQSMALHDNAVWIVTATAGVWRAPLGSGQWERAHRGLPTAESPHSGTPIHKLTRLDGHLYALSGAAVYRRRSDSWKRFTSNAFSKEVGVDGPKFGLQNLVRHQWRLVAVTRKGLYVLDETTGAHRLFWKPNETLILTARGLSSGLYVGTRNRGVRRHGRTP
ncbi:MAG: hypothetical protein ABEN55_13810, partial [Bradymonadaceae bacterium]